MMSSDPEPRETTARGSLAAMRQQGVDRRASVPMTQPALTRCDGCLQLIAFLDGDLCEDCVAKR